MAPNSEIHARLPLPSPQPSLPPNSLVSRSLKIECSTVSSNSMGSAFMIFSTFIKYYGSIEPRSLTQVAAAQQWKRQCKARDVREPPGCARP